MNRNELARFLFLREAWKTVIADGDTDWIEECCKVTDDAPGAGASSALVRLLAAGAQPSDLATVVRVMQYHTMFRLCYLLEDPGDLEPEAGDVAWGLFETDSFDAPIRRISAPHESVLEADPTGCEMRPAASGLEL